MIALTHIAPQRGERLGLLGGFNPFGDDDQIQVFRHRHDRSHQRRRLRVDMHAAHEGTVDLERVERQLAQVQQAGVPGAEIVERNPDALFPQRFKDGPGGVQVRHQRRFRQLDFKPRGREGGFLEDAEQFLGQFLILKLYRGQVERQVRGAIRIDGFPARPPQQVEGHFPNRA